MSAEFEDTLRKTDIEQCITRVEHAVKCRHPVVTVLFIKPQTRELWMAGSTPNETAE